MEGSSNNDDDNSGGADAPVVEQDVQQADASCELANTPKLPLKYTKCGHERDEITTKILAIMENDFKELDDIEMVMGAIAKCLKKGLHEDEIDAAVDELNEVVGRHLRQARERKAGYNRPAATAPAPTQPPAYTQLPQMPPLQRMDQTYTYDVAMNNTTYQNL